MRKCCQSGKNGIWSVKSLAKAVAATALGIPALSHAALPAPTVTLSTIGNNAYNGTGTNSINSVAISRNNVVTRGSYQYVAYYDNSTPSVRLARRLLSGGAWSVFDTGYVPFAVTDDHDNISIAIDGDGYMHMSWGMHNNTMNYVVSNTSVNSVASWTAANVTFSRPTFWNQTTGNTHSSVTYPEFVYIPNSPDMMFLYRQGASGNGDLYFVKYNTATKTWTKNLAIRGTNDSINAYWNNPIYDSTGKLLMTWTFRDTPAFQSNENILYAQSLDNGTTWQNQSGSAYTLPITRSQAQIISTIPENSTLINQTTMTVDRYDRPMVATWYAPKASEGDNTRQYMLEWYNGTSWQSSQITYRPTESLQTDSTVRELARPIVLTDEDNRVLVVMRYKEVNNNIVVAISDDRVTWETITLSSDNMGVYEPTYDAELWKRENKLHLYHQRLGTGGSNTVSILEWNAKAYFDALPTLNFWSSSAGGNWNDSTWTGGVPNAAGAYVGLGGGAAVLSGPATLTVTGTKTVGVLKFNDANNSFTLAAGVGGMLNLDNGGSAAGITVAAGNHTVAVPVTFPTAGATLTVAQPQYTLTLSSSISGGALTKAGPGTVSLTGTASVSSLAVTGGTLKVENTGSIGTVAVTLTGGTLAYGPTGTLNVVNNISGATGTVRQDGPGTLSFSGSNSFGTVSVAGGRLNHTVSIPSGVALSLSGGTYDLNGTNATFSSLSGSGGRLADLNGASGTTTVTFNAGSAVNATFYGAIQGTPTRTLAFVKTGTGTLTLSGSSANSSFTVLQGDLGYGATGAFGNAVVTVTPQSASTSADARARILLSNGVTLANNIVLNGHNTNYSGAITVPGANDSATITGTITVNNGFLGTGNTLFGPTGTGLLTIAGPLNNSGPNFVGVRNGNVRFSYPGGTTGSVSLFRINQGNISLGADNGLPSMADVDMSPSGSSTFDLRGYDQTLASVTRSSGSSSATITNSSTGDRSVLTTTSASNFTMPALLTGNLSYRHAGLGTATLAVTPTNSGEIAATGSGRVVVSPILRSGILAASNGGNVTLNLAGSSSTNVLVGDVGALNVSAGGTVTIPSVSRSTTRQKVLITGTLSIDSAGSVDVGNADVVVRAATEAIVRAEVASWWNEGGRNGFGLGSSLPAAATSGVDALATLAVAANVSATGTAYTTSFAGVSVTTTDILVKYTYLGDTDLSGKVDAQDLANLVAGLRSSTSANPLTGWRNGDTNYDNVVDGSDFSNLLLAMRLQGASFGDGPETGGGGGAVPEPSAAAALLLVPAFLGRRTRRE